MLCSQAKVIRVVGKEQEYICVICFPKQTCSNASQKLWQQWETCACAVRSDTGSGSEEDPDALKWRLSHLFELKSE